MSQAGADGHDVTRGQRRKSTVRVIVLAVVIVAGLVTIAFALGMHPVG